MKLFRKSAVICSLLSVATIVPVSAQQAAPMPGMNMPMPGRSTPAENSMMSTMDKMMKDMAAVPMTGNADREFAAMMIPHHQGAIDMAKGELARGKDPEMMTLARDVIRAQEREIAGMKAWLSKHPDGK